MPKLDWSVLRRQDGAPSTDSEAPARPAETEALPSPDGADPRALAAAGAALRPEVRTLLARLLQGEAIDSPNLCVLIGTVVVERGRGGMARHTRTPLGLLQGIVVIEVDEVAGAGGAVALRQYRIRLGITRRLFDAGVFVDGQRVAVVGPLRLERTYDGRFARGDLDVGLPRWELRVDVIAAEAVPEEVPESSWVQVAGTVASDPRIRMRPIGPHLTLPFATLYLTCHPALRGAQGRDQGTYPAGTIVPLEVALDGTLPQAGALLRRGNAVRLEGRLGTYAYQRPSSDPEVAAALARVEAEVHGPQDSRAAAWVRRTKQRLLTVVQTTVEVGYVECCSGEPMREEAIAQLIAAAQRPQRSRERAGDSTSVDPQAAPAREAMEAAAATLPAPADVDSPAGAIQISPTRPRRRVRDPDRPHPASDSDDES